MSEIKINSTRQNHTVHKARIEEGQLLALVVSAAADLLGLDPTAENIKVRAYTSSYRDGDMGMGKTCVEVELIESHQETQ